MDNQKRNFMDLSHIPWGEVKNHDYDVVVLPWGAIEPHNLHLPYITDCILSYEIAIDSAKIAYEKSNTKSMVMPPVYFGAQNPGQWNKPFCIHTRIETQKAILTDIVSSLHGQGFRKLVIVNGHGGNSFKPLIRDLAVTYPDFYIIAIDWFGFIPTEGYFEEKPDEHAGEQETSVMLHYHPELVDMNEAGSGRVNPIRMNSLQNKTGWVPRNWDEVTTDTGIGNPKKSTAEKGKIYAEKVVERIADLLTELKDYPV